MTGEASQLHALLFNAWGLVLVVVLFGGSIFVHELGHFLAARHFGLKVDRFSIGFGPKMFGWTGRDGVEYRVSWFPLGGYVALPQLADMRELEGEPGEEVRELPPVHYHAKMVVLVAGAVFNVIFALALACVLWVVGAPVPQGYNTDVVGFVHEKIFTAEGRPAQPGPAFVAGLRAGDRIVAVDGEPVNSVREARQAIIFGSGRDDDHAPLATITYERGGAQHTAQVRPLLITLNERSGDAIRDIGFGPVQPPVVGAVMENSPAIAAGVRRGDRILALNGEPIASFPEFYDRMGKLSAVPLTLEIRRESADGVAEQLTIRATPVMSTTMLPLATVKFGEGVARIDAFPEFPKEAGQSVRTAPTSSAKVLRIADVSGDARWYGDLRPGDKIWTIDGKPVKSVAEMVVQLQSTPADAPALVRYMNEDTISTTLLRRPFAAEVTPAETRPMLGIQFTDSEIAYLSPLRQFRDALVATVGMLSALLSRNSDVGVSMMSGPVGIGRAIHNFSIEDVRKALWLTVIVNLNLAILNLLPIPVLDGGHMLLATIARIRGRALPANVLVATQGAFMMLLVGLMIFVLYFDSQRWVGDREAEERVLRGSSPALEPNFSSATGTPAAPAASDAP